MRGEERRITSQHERLDALCRDVYTRIDEDGPTRARGDFEIFVTALDAHMTVEEDIYFPAIHGLRSETGEELIHLVEAHAALRRAVEEIGHRLEDGDREGARSRLGQLARAVSQHEREEEDLLARITQGPLTALRHPSPSS
jgi:hemerythrin superfamily protein